MVLFLYVFLFDVTFLIVSFSTTLIKKGKTMSGARLIIGLPIAAAVTVGLFVMMSNVLQDGDELPPTIDYQDITINAKVPPPNGPKDPPTIDISTLPDAPEPIITTRNEPTDRPRPIKSEPPAPPKGPTGFTPGGTGNYIPIHRVEPNYPNNCLSRGLEGSVIVEFDLTPEGGVMNPRIFSSSNRCFNRAVINAVTRWRYSAPGSIIRNIRTTLTFNLGQ